MQILKVSTKRQMVNLELKPKSKYYTLWFFKQKEKNHMSFTQSFQISSKFKYHLKP